MRKAKLAVLVLGAALAVSACGGKDKGQGDHRDGVAAGNRCDRGDRAHDARAGNG